MSSQVFLRSVGNWVVARGLFQNIATFREGRSTLRNLCHRQLPQPASSCAIRIPGGSIPISPTPSVSGFRPPVICLYSAFGASNPH